ncbi:STAS domain-containing protein [Gaiella sp.]|uniref:STAS domain-containing protein n=1 Tax=Gaiella sp. TaxID=2663207 RepID=UPI0032677219
MDCSHGSRDAYRLGVESGESDGVIVITVRGEADLNEAPILRDALSDAIASRAQAIVVDMSGVTFIDSMMLGVLLGASRAAGPQGIDLRIVVTDPHVRRMFELTLLDRVLDLYPLRELALEPGSASGVA